MTSGSCPRCRSVLEEDASFCHSCGLDLGAAALPGAAISPAAEPRQVATPAVPMLPGPGMEVPANPVDHGRALAAIAATLMLFNSAVILVFGIIYLADRSVGWEEAWVGDDWYDERVYYWEWVIASLLMMGSSAAGVAGGIAAARATRFNLAMSGAALLLVSTIILEADFGRWTYQGFGEIAFVLVLAILPVALLLSARPSFTEPAAPPGGGGPAFGTDNYGWSTTGADRLPRVVGGRRDGP